MNVVKNLIYIGFLCVDFWSCNFIQKSEMSQSGTQIKGITLVAPPKPFSQNPMHAIKAVHAEWIALVPYAFSKKGNPEIYYQNLDWQWWGERPEGIRESIRLAKEAGLKVMLKPQVWIHGEWVGTVDFHSEEEWQRWEEDYTMYLMTLVHIAIEYDVEMICIGTEYQIAAIRRETYFRNLISEIRKMYKGRLTFSANWDQYADIAFWDALDYIGVSAYFPLLYDTTPGVDQLTEAWQPHVTELEAFSKKANLPILFTEMGYLSVDGCAGKTWELEQHLKSCTLNQEAQANAYKALFTVFRDKSFWAGGFIWKWFPNGEGHEGFPEKDYTPQHKKAEAVLKHAYN
jgi:hypothetical protein